ncbi:MAG: hypothetical protein AAFP03_05125 [Cyanobacteria bacterium J06598_3]
MTGSLTGSLTASVCLLATACTLSSASQPSASQPSISQESAPNNRAVATVAEETAEETATDKAVTGKTATDKTATDKTFTNRADVVQSSEITELTTAPKNSTTSNQNALQSVPPNGLESLTEDGFSYFQQMGPLEYAVRLGGLPQPSAWRARLRLYPSNTGQPDGQTYLVKLDHYNLSPALYRDLLPSYGENTDPSLAEDRPHQNFQFTFFPVMGMAADVLPEATFISQSPMAENPDCGIDLACADLRMAPVIEPSNATDISPEIAPWETEVEPVYSLVRALATQAGWRTAAGSWSYAEVPEGLSSDTPWVEIVIDNYIGNGDGYSAEWIERVADDSIRQVVHQIVYSDRPGIGQATTKYVCARGESAGELSDICP